MVCCWHSFSSLFLFLALLAQMQRQTLGFVFKNQHQSTTEVSPLLPIHHNYKSIIMTNANDSEMRTPFLQAQSNSDNDDNTPVVRA